MSRSEPQEIVLPSAAVSFSNDDLINLLGALTRFRIHYNVFFTYDIATRNEMLEILTVQGEPSLRLYLRVQCQRLGVTLVPQVDIFQVLILSVISPISYDILLYLDCKNELGHWTPQDSDLFLQ
jgi:hypothetical protein